MRSRRIVWVTASLAFILASWQGQAAFAAVAEPNTTVTGAGQSATDPGSGRHCTIEVEPVTAGTPADAAPRPEVECFGTFAKAVSHATNGEVKLSDDATLSDADPQLRATSKSGPLIGIEYDGSSYGGSSRTIFAPRGEGCYAGKQYYVPNMASIDFDDTVSSAKVYANCLSKHYQLADYEGWTFLCEGSCPGLGRMDNRTSSIRFF